MRTETLTKRAAPAAKPMPYAGEWVLATAEGLEPPRDLTPHEETDLVRGGFCARRWTHERGAHLVLTRKGRDLAEDIAAEVLAGCGA
jgi:hypothetical protein